MNIILVVFDTLRKDCVGAYGRPPWGEVLTPHFDAFARQSVVFDRVYPESLPTLPARRALYTGKRVYPFHDADYRLKGDFLGAPGWGPIPEDVDTVAEMLRETGYRTGLIADLYHMFKPSKNYTRGFDQWTFLRGQEEDPSRSGPLPTREEIDFWLPRELQTPERVRFIKKCLLNMRGRVREEDFFNARVMIEASRWLEENQDAGRFFLVVESFDPHEPWFVPAHYRRMYDAGDGREQVVSLYAETAGLDPALLRRTQANYSGLVTMCDRWFGSLMESVRVLGLEEDTVVIFTSDHGHHFGDQGFLGKRGYPSGPGVFDVPLMIRHPERAGAHARCAALLQHTDIAAQILTFAGVRPARPQDGRPFWSAAVKGGEPVRDHVTAAWGSAMTVIRDRWWLNCKVNGRGVFLRDITSPRAFEENVADANPAVVRELYRAGVSDAVGGFPDYLMRLAESQEDAPGCSGLAARG